MWLHEESSPENSEVSKTDVSHTLSHGMESLSLWRIKQVKLWLQVTHFQEPQPQRGDRFEMGSHNPLTSWRRQWEK